MSTSDTASSALSPQPRADGPRSFLHSRTRIDLSWKFDAWSTTRKSGKDSEKLGSAASARWRAVLKDPLEHGQHRGVRHREDRVEGRVPGEPAAEGARDVLRAVAEGAAAPGAEHHAAVPAGGRGAQHAGDLPVQEARVPVAIPQGRGNDCDLAPRPAALVRKTLHWISALFCSYRQQSTLFLRIVRRPNAGKARNGRGAYNYYM